MAKKPTARAINPMASQARQRAASVAWSAADGHHRSLRDLVAIALEAR